MCTGNYNDKSGSVAIVISKADADLHGHRLHGSYDATAHGATRHCTGVTA